VIFGYIRRNKHQFYRFPLQFSHRAEEVAGSNPARSTGKFPLVEDFFKAGWDTYPYSPDVQSMPYRVINTERSEVELLIISMFTIGQFSPSS
jgi:hypothetical protein